MSDEPPVTPRVDGNDDGGRDKSGKFRRGNSFGKGNPYLTRVHALRAKLVECATEGDMERIFKQVAEQAAGGDMVAARLWLEYAVGKPSQAIEISGNDGEPLNLQLARVEDALLAALMPYGNQVRFAVAMALRGLTADAEPAE